jgi:hypothetical protein
MASRRRVGHTRAVAKRAVKSLHRTGRVSRKRARAVAKRLLDEIESGEIKPASGAKIKNRTTASGRSAISFHVVSSKTDKTRKSQGVRRAACKAAR